MLYSNGGTNYSKYDCCTLWDSLPPDKQCALHNNIRTRLQQGRYVSFNAYRAMQESLREIDRLRRPSKHPTNYNGARSLPSEPLVRAVYNGTGGIYTRQEAELFHMDIRGDFVL